MDGNGRWAAERHLSRSDGHRAGAETAKAIITACRRLSIPHLSLYAFSKENWSRPKLEISSLFDLLGAMIKRELGTLLEQSIRLNILGDISELPLITRKLVKEACAKTAHCQAMTLNLALNYSSRDEIVRACRALMAEKIPPEQITEKCFSEHLYTAGQPDPDLIIRTSGEMRLSNFLMYQAAYSELYFTRVTWPEFSENDLMQALEAFKNRDRRFGGLQ